MNSKHGLSSETLAKIAEVLECFAEVDRAVMFGSRAKGTHKHGSDIDLALVGSGLEWRKIGKIYDALDELPLPYRFSVIRLDAGTDPDVAAHIARVGIPIFDRAPVADAHSAH